ncbi:hypothetical protein MRX96_012493 [Rhipicephalus microplus]
MPRQSPCRPRRWQQDLSPSLVAARFPRFTTPNNEAVVMETPASPTKVRGGGSDKTTLPVSVGKRRRGVPKPVYGCFGGRSGSLVSSAAARPRRDAVQSECGARGSSRLAGAAACGGGDLRRGKPWRSTPPAFSRRSVSPLAAAVEYVSRSGRLRRSRRLARGRIAYVSRARERRERGGKELVGVEQMDHTICHGCTDRNVRPVPVTEIWPQLDLYVRVLFSLAARVRLHRRRLLGEDKL